MRNQDGIVEKHPIHRGWQVWGFYTNPAKTRECINCGDLTDEFVGLQKPDGRWLYRHPRHHDVDACAVVREGKRGKTRWSSVQVRNAQRRANKAQALRSRERFDRARGVSHVD